MQYFDFTEFSIYIRNISLKLYGCNYKYCESKKFICIEVRSMLGNKLLMSDHRWNLNPELIGYPIGLSIKCIVANPSLHEFENSLLIGLKNLNYLSIYKNRQNS